MQRPPEQCLLHHCRRPGFACEDHNKCDGSDDEVPYLDEAFEPTRNSHIAMLERAEFWKVYYRKKIQLDGYHNSP